MPNKDINKLNEDYKNSELADRKVFSDQRGNVRLVNGDHYNNTQRNYWNRVRDDRTFTQDQKVRITQNHIHNVSKTYVNSILSLAQDPYVAPQNDSEITDQKTAELNNSVWEHIKKENNFNELREKFACDYFDIGEVVAKVMWNPDIGEIVAYEQAIDMNNEPMFDENNEPVFSNKPIKTGGIGIKRIFAFNLLRDPSANSKHECRYLIERYMADIKEVKSWVKGDQDKIDKINESQDETYKVFNGATGEYEDSKGQVLIKEFYYKPSAEYPNGYYYIAAPNVILFEGELPFGLFPIVWSGFDDIQTSCRSRSMIKQLRPYQAEINRAVSHIVEIQLSNGHDKIFTQDGSKVSPQKWLPGVRAYSITGGPPTIIEGRSGDQYLNYINMQISNLYRAAKIDEVSVDKQMNADPYTLLFSTARQKKAFSSYASRFGRFLIEVCELSLRFAKAYYTPDLLIPVIGRKEIVNITEFLNSDPLGYSIKIIESNDDTESVIGKQLAIQTIMQYGGSALSKEDIGKLARNMPYLNKEDILEDLTLDYDAAKNAILALDRGAFPLVNRYDDHKYMIQRIVNRMRKSDFEFLDPVIQQNYDAYLKLHQEFEVAIQKEIQLAQSGFIPAGGILVTVDYYVEKDGKQKRVRLPQDSISWLIEKLDQQGSYYEDIKNLNQAALADMSSQLNNTVSVNNTVGGNTQQGNAEQIALPDLSGLDGLA